MKINGELQNLLFSYFHQEHDIMLLDSDFREIENIINSVNSYKRFHPQTGYEEAKKWLQEIGEWDYVSTHGFSTDGWSIVATANSMWDERNGS